MDSPVSDEHIGPIPLLDFGSGESQPPSDIVQSANPPSSMENDFVLDNKPSDLLADFSVPLPVEKPPEVSWTKNQKKQESPKT